MRIISFNANGIRSAGSKGFFDWLKQQNADVTCIQETKAQEDQLGDPMFRPDGHHCFYKDATTKKGYSGVAIYAKREPDELRTGLGWAPFDDEGRYIEARFGKLSVVSFYIPSGSSGDLRQGFKFEVMEWLKPILDEWLRSGRDYVLCGDWNIVRSALDIKNWKSNQKNSGCLPAERDWLNGVMRDLIRRAPGLTAIVRSTRKARTTRGGATAARRAPTMSAGASITRSSRHPCAIACSTPQSRHRRAFLTTPPTRWTTRTRPYSTSAPLRRTSTSGMAASIRPARAIHANKNTPGKATSVVIR